MRLLLVEDDEVLAAGLLRRLRTEGFAVDVATNGVDAEHLGVEEGYDIAVLDLGLPDRAGIDVLENWRRAHNMMPVLILTARSEWQQKVEGFKSGADDYLTKPFHTEELIVRIRALIRRSAQRADANGELTAPGITLDEERQSVRVGDGQPVALTGMEFRLLRYFMSHPGKVLSKTRLAEHVYELDADRDSNVIEVYVTKLRRKVGAHAIETRRGQGYVFAAGGNRSAGP